MENSQKPLNDEIDLIAIIARTFKVIKKRILLIALFLVVDVLVGIIFFYTFKPTYSTQAVAQTRSINYLEVRGILMNLNTYLEEKNYEAFAKKTQMSVEDASMIKEIDSQGIGSLVDDMQETDKRDSIFVIKALIKDNAVIPNLQTKVFQYLNNNPYIKKVNDNYEAQLKQNLKRIQADIAELDSSKIFLKKQLKSNDNIADLKFVNIGEVYQQSVRLYEQEKEIKRELLLGNEISIIDNFAKYQKPINGLGKVIIISTVIAFVLSIFLIILLEIRVAVKKYEENNAKP